MPKRVIDFDAMWASDKIAACANWAQAEYAWLYGLADASGCFELTNLRVIWGRVSAIRKDLTLDRLEKIFDEFIAHGLLFTWEENGKRYAHWTGSDVPGRLPAPSWRARLEHLAPAVPRAELAAYTARYAARRRTPAEACAGTMDTQHSDTEPGNAFHAGRATSWAGAVTPGAFVVARTAEVKNEAPDPDAEPRLKPCLEAPQPQDWNLNSDKDKERENTHVCALLVSPRSTDEPSENAGGPEQLLAIYEAARGALPPAERMTPDRRRHCKLRLRAGLSPAEFSVAVQRAGRTPFLAGAGDRGWRANFDWFVANDTNVRKVLEGCYDPPSAVAEASSNSAAPSWAAHMAHPPAARGARNGYPSCVPAALYAGLGPPASASGARIKPAALARMRARNAAEQRLPLWPQGAAAQGGFDVEAGVAPGVERSVEGDVGPDVERDLDHKREDDARRQMCEPVRTARQKSIREEKAS